MKKNLSLFILLVLAFAVSHYERAEALNAACLATGSSCIDNGCEALGGFCQVAVDICRPGSPCPCQCIF
jgi:hypothetical protein